MLIKQQRKYIVKMFQGEILVLLLSAIYLLCTKMPPRAFKQGLFVKILSFSRKKKKEIGSFLRLGCNIFTLKMCILNIQYKKKTSNIWCDNYINVQVRAILIYYFSLIRKHPPLVSSVNFNSSQNVTEPAFNSKSKMKKLTVFTYIFSPVSFSTPHRLTPSIEQMISLACLHTLERSRL